MRRVGRLLVFVVLAIAFISSAKNVSAWSNSSFDKCMNITILNSGSETLTNFPAYINLTYDSDMLADFTDIRFYNTTCDNGGVPLDYETENYTLSDRAHVWVRIPSLPAAGTNISVYYKNNTAVSSGENATGVWDSNYVGVWHMTETSGMRYDSTSNSNNLTDINSTGNGIGMVAGAADFENGDENFLIVNDADQTGLDLNNSDYTFTFWIKPEDSVEDGYSLYDKGYQGVGVNCYISQWNGWEGWAISHENGGWEGEVSSWDTIELGVWHYYSVSFNVSSGDMIFGQNGVFDAPDNMATSPPDNNESFAIGREIDRTYLDGLIDEFRVSNIPRSAAWINQSYLIVANQNSYVTLGSEQTIPYINNCSVLDTAGKTYILTQDILNSNNATCMNITADNVTLDCGGHTINGKDTYDSNGVYTKANSATIKNCLLTDWWYGVRISNNYNNIIENVSASSNEYGIYMLISDGNIINKSNLQSNNADGIRMSQASYNEITDSVSSGNLGNGIYLTNSHWNTITNISSYSNIFSGINLSDSNNNNMTSSKLYSNVNYGVGLLSSNSTSISNMSSFGNQKSGVYLQSSSNNNISAINSYSNSIHGFYLFSSSNQNNFSKIYGNDNNINGLYFESSSNNIVTSCGFNYNTVYGIVTQLSSNNNFTDCNLTSNEDVGIRLYDSSNHYFTDSIVFNSTNYDIYSYGSNNNYFINATFNQSKSSINNNAVIWIKWYLYTNVVNSNTSSPIEDANVTIIDKFGSYVFNGLTNSSGHIPRQTLTEYNETPSGKNYYSNYSINVSRTGFLGNTTNVTLTYSRTFTIYIEGPGQPYIDVKTYTLGLAETDIFKPGRIVRVRAFVSSSLGREHLVNSTIQIKDSSGSNVVNNVLMANVSNITNGYVYEYNYTIPSNANGIWSITVTATDFYILKGYGYKKIAVIPLTLQIKLVLNSTSDNMYIPGIGELSFSSLTTREYTTPEHYYIASYSNDILKSVVFSQLNPITVFTEKGSATYGIGVSQRFSGSMLFIAFSKGSWRTINNRVELIERGEFLSYSEPSFGFGLGGSYPVKVLLEYNNIDINKTIKIGRGYNKLVIENMGESGEKVSVRFDRP